MQDECWLYAGLINYEGYGLVYSKGKIYRAHRVMYEREHGLLTSDIVLDHLCRVRSCINPDHLEAVTSRENILRGVGTSAMNARKTHCINGHEYNEGNTYFAKRGTRDCRICHNARTRARRARAKL